MTLIQAPPDTTPSESSDLLQQLAAIQKEKGNIQSFHTTLSDRYGPRLLGSATYAEALKWIAVQLDDAADSIWYHDYGAERYRSWSVERLSGELLSPVYQTLSLIPRAYCRGTGGEIKGDVLVIDSLSQLRNWEDSLAGKVLLLMHNYRSPAVEATIQSRRFTDEELQTAADNPDPNHLVLGYLARRPIRDAIRNQMLRRIDRASLLDFCRKAGALAILEPSDYPYGILHVDAQGTVPSYFDKNTGQPLPSFIIANEQAGRIRRLAQAGEKVRVRLQLEVDTTDYPAAHRNLIAEIKGDSEEYIAIGAHLDSWHAGTGAADNGAGVAIMVEAFKLLAQLDMPLERSVRLFLWAGEEQVFRGSASYVADHLGDLYTGARQPEQRQMATYLNLDNGAGRIRGLYLNGQSRVKEILEPWLDVFPNDNYLTIQYSNQTDHELFDALSIPSFQFIQDPLQYMQAVHHTSVDVPEYVPIEDLVFNARYVAFLVAKLANAKQPLPRKKWNRPVPSTAGKTLFELAGYPDAKEIYLVGSFNNWNLFGTPMAKTENGWFCRLNLPPGEYDYKFIIDGYWTADPATPGDEIYSDGKGHGGLSKKVVAQ